MGFGYMCMTGRQPWKGQTVTDQILERLYAQDRRTGEGTD